MQKLKKADTVRILLGKDRGKTGSVERVLTKDGKILVPGVNIYKRHVRKFQGVEGGIIDIAKPIDVSNVALVCPGCKRPTRVGFIIGNGVKKRICKKCRKELV